MKKILMSLLAAATLFGLASPSNAIQFAVVNPRFGQTFQYFYDNPTQTLGVNPSPALVTFNYLVPGTPFGGNTVNALLTFSGKSLLAASPGPPIVQSVDTFTFKITVDPLDPTYGGVYGGKILLENIGVGTSANITASGTGLTAQLDTDNSGGNTLTFNSDFLLLSGTEAATWSYSDVKPKPITINAGNGFIDSITLGGNGNFISDQFVVPEPGMVALLLSTSLGGSVLLMRRRRK